ATARTKGLDRDLVAESFDEHDRTRVAHARKRASRPLRTPAGHGFGPRASPRVYSGATSSPPHASGATSSSVSENVHWWPAGSSAAYCRSPYSKSVGSMRMRAPCILARSQWASTSSTRTITECVTSPGRGRAPLAAHVADDDRAVAEAELRAVVLAD